MRTLLITDLHFTPTPVGLLEAQRNCILRLLEEEEYEDVIIMGDLMMHRNPTPSVLLALKSVVDWCMKHSKPLTILRGNHDSETKADDGVTALSLFDYHAKVITKTWFDPTTKRAFIPHYENEEHIKKDLDSVPNGYTMFGHFGYRGSLNSAGDADFNLSLSDFRTTSYLGHVHGYVSKEKVTILGTPYSTNFGETLKENFYGILSEDGLELKTLNYGPRHLIYNVKNLNQNLEEINNPHYFTMLRVLIDSDHTPIPYEDLKVAHIDTKYTPTFDEEKLSSYVPERDLFAINEMIIQDYINEANTTLPKELLMQGYRLLLDED